MSKTEPNKVLWGLVDAASNADGTVRHVNLFEDVGDRRYIQLGLRAYMSLHNLTLKDISFEEGGIRLKKLWIPLEDNNSFRLNWNSRESHDSKDVAAPDRIPFVRIWDYEVDIRHSRSQLKKFFEGEKRDYFALANKSDYEDLRRHELDILDSDNPRAYQDLIQSLSPLKPLKHFNSDTRVHLDKARKSIQSWKQRHDILLPAIQDKVVIIGNKGTSSFDRRPSPINPDEDMVNLHSTVYSNLKNASFVSPVASLWQSLVMAGVYLLCLPVFLKKSFSFKVMTVAIVVLMTFAISYLAFLKGGWLLKGTTFLIGFGILFFGSTIVKEYISYAQRSFFRKHLRRYLSHNIADYFERNPDAPTQGKKMMTVLFSDIRGFTPFCEGMDAETIRTYVQRIMDRLTPIVFEYGGTLDKYMGDCIMCFFGAPMEDPQHALNAARCALKMRDELTQLSATFVKEGLKALDMGIGVSTGTMAFGDFGSSENKDYTVLGDAVNIGSRVEGMTRLIEEPILITADTYEAIHKDVLADSVGEHMVKGKSRPIHLYALRGLK